MITLGICFIYYGIALFLYQVYGWIGTGTWTPFPVSRAWEGFFGAPRLENPYFDGLANWFLTWPMGFTLLAGGMLVLCTAFGYKKIMELRRDRLRFKWLLEQCEAAGYKPWAVPKVMRELDNRLESERISRSERIS